MEEASEEDLFVKYVVDFAERLVKAMERQGSIRAIDPGGPSTQRAVGWRTVYLSPPLPVRVTIDW